MAVKKTVKKAAPKKGFSLSDIGAGLKQFEFRVMNKDTREEKAPYIIPFRHRGLQKITGGILGGTLAEISGMSGGGKSFLGYELIAECQKIGGVCILFDGENAWEDAYAKMLGINMDDGTFMVSMERDIDICFAMMTSIIDQVRIKKHNIPILFVIDSFFTLATKVAIEKAKKGADPQGFYHKQKNGKFSTQLTTFVPSLGKNKATLVLLNQTRKLVNEYTGMISYKTLAEEVIQFLCTQRIQGILANKKDTEEVSSTNTKGTVKTRSGIKTVWETIKNRTYKPFQKITTHIKYESGLRRSSGLTELFVNEGLIRPSTTSFTPEGFKMVPNKGAKKNDTDIVGKPLKGYITIDDDVFYYSMNSILEARPEFLKPIKTADSIQREIEEDFE